ncbi:unnamed protein product [Paramecium sonneborni]|uniref:Transmembrane protein n=1 Tax=Paramecium sonneborni TaxID=65129 RepID=A0A8S1LKT0_9CILI|nr:unnamed protein product [Paramecium sonneborni]
MWLESVILMSQILAGTFEILDLNPQNQRLKRIIAIRENDYQLDYCFTYGLWSKYNPLGKINQVGLFGLFDGYCYHLHSALSQETQSLNLIYYDCLNKQEKTIKKTIQFINNEEEQLQFDLIIDTFEYENIWYFMQIVQWPQLNRFELIITKQQQLKIHEIIQIKRPYSDKNLILTFGSNLIVGNSKIANIKTGETFQYFPGFIRIEDYSEQNLSPQLDFISIASENYNSFKTCVCQQNENLNINDQVLSDYQQSFYISQNSNCDSFILQGWIKIIKIVQVSEEFIYQLIKIGANIENSIIEDQNLSPFQMYYYLSKKGDHIEITTYSYLFPDILIDFKVNPFLIRDQLTITNSISLWHFIKAELRFNKINIELIFYDRENFGQITKQYEVNQFTNYQLKVQFGNGLQLYQNQIEVELRQFQFYNCYQQLNQQYCHYSCLTCDGPTNENCLSCSESSQRIYLSEFKVCICPYNTLDEFEVCQTYIDSGLTLLNTNKIPQQCQQGYFEIDKECYQCPSIVKESIITCLECYSNPLNWQFDLTCQTSLILFPLGSIQDSLIPIGQDQYYFDGTNLNYRYDYYVYSSRINLENIENMYKEMELILFGFKHFCQQQEYRISNSTLCYLCKNQHCLTCITTLTGLQCLQCENSFILINGICNSINFTKDDPICIPPDYISYSRQCKQCIIKNCIYCFEYLSYSQNFCSLWPFSQIDQNDLQYVKIGCALCENNYIFDFTINLCILQKPQLQNCLRSFIDYNNIELCTLSNEQDFSIAPEIISCQNYIQNCQQCSLNIKSKIQCVVCENGFIVENNQCLPNEEFKLPDYLIQSQTSKIQSFMLQFIPILNIYQYKNYLLPKENQFEYCGSDCIDCDRHSFYNCNKCPLNYFKKQIKAESGRNCSDCPQLCQVCISRSDLEIKAVQPKFLITQDNEIFTKKCIKPYIDSAIYFDSYNQISKYCFNKQCNDSFAFRFSYQSCDFSRFNRNYEQKINTQYCNSVGIQSIDFYFTLEIQSDECQLFFPLIFKTQLKQKIFTLRKILFKMQSQKQILIQPVLQTQFINFDEVELNNLDFSTKENHYFILDNNLNSINLTLINITFDFSLFNNLSSLFQSANFDIINLTNITISNSILNNASIFKLEQQIQNGSVNINSLIILNCTFNNSTLFYISNIQTKIIIQNFRMENCQLFHSQIFHLATQIFSSILLSVTELSVQNNHIQNSMFINCTNFIELRLIHFKFQYNNLSNSIIIGVHFKFELNQILIKQNLFLSSQFFVLVQKLSVEKVNCLLNNIKIIENKFQTSNLIMIYSTLASNDLFLYVENTYINRNSKLTSQSGFESLFHLNCHQLFFKMIIVNNSNLIILFLTENQYIQIENLKYSDSQNDYKIPLPFTFSEQNLNQTNKLIVIKGINFISIYDLKVENYTSFDESLIDISQSCQLKENKIGQIHLQNITFKNNILIQIHQIYRLSLLSLESDQLIQVFIQNITFIQNIFHSYANFELRTSGSLLFIFSSLSSIEIYNFLSYYNVLTNSSSAFVTICSDQLKFNNYTIQYQNYLSQQQWDKYYDIKWMENQNYENFNNVIFSNLNISNMGGAGKLQASVIYCLNCFFEYILSQKSFAFDITTTGQGNISLVNLTVKNAENNLESRENNQGCININSVNSQLNLMINNAKFVNIQNRMATSILTISPSQISNYLILKNVKIENCFSLLNPIMKIQFSQLIANKNFVNLKNLNIIQNFEMWNFYFSKIKTLSNQELNEIVNENNALISIESGNVSLTGILIEGTYISPIMKFQNVILLSVVQLRMENVILLYQLTLIDVSQLVKIKSIIKFQQIEIKNLSVYEILIQPNKNQDQKYDFNQQKPIEKSFLLDYFKENVLLLQSLYQDYISIFHIKSFSNQNSFYFNSIKLINNNCQQCQNGMMFFQIDELKQIKISNLNCIFNKIKTFGCLYFVRKKYNQSKIIIYNSNFLFNTGTQGIAISCVNTYLKMFSGNIVYNSASGVGGGIYFESNQGNFIFNRSIIIFNKAKRGGGIYFQGRSSLNLNNFINSLLLFNKAIEQGNNLIEIPAHLALQINSQDIPSSSQKINQIQTNQMKLQPYKIIEQGQVREFNDLIIPSNQIIKNFEIFDLKQSRYKLFIENIHLYYKNSRNEILQNIFNSTCQVNQTIFTKSLSQIENQKKNQIFQFGNEKNYFDVSALEFTLDPFEQNYEYLQISIFCKFIEQENGLMYKINVKSIQCQLGEFYINEGCQICQSNQGFYSVTYNTTKCSIFDKTKFSNITANMIELLPGYWRPDNLSDFTEKCFKNQAFCQGGWFVGQNLCIPGHIGALCEECDIHNIRGFGNYFKNQWDQYCYYCQDTWNDLLSLILIIFWAFLSIGLSLKSFNKSNILFAQLKLVRRYNKILFKLNQDHEGILIKLMINYLWIFSVIFTFNISFSFSFQFIEQTSNSSYSLASQLDCQLQKISKIPIIYLKLFTLITFIVSQFNIIFMASYWYSKRMKYKYDLSILTNTLLYLYIVNYAGLMKMLSSIVSVREISNILYIQGDVTLLFGNQSHKFWIYYFILPGLIFFGCVIPIIIFLFLLVNRNNIDQIKLRKHICFLLNEYENQSYFWEQIKQLKKALIILILTHFETQILFKASLLGLCLLIYQILAAYQKPFVTNKFNSLDLEAGQICSISIFLAAIKYLCEQQNKIEAQIVIQILIIALFMKLCFPFVENIFRIYNKKYKKLFLTVLLNFFQFFGSNFILTMYLNKTLKQQKEKEQRLQNNFIKLRDYLINFTKIQQRNTKQIIFQNSLDRIQTIRSNRSNFEKIYFLGTGEENNHII